MLLLFSPLEKSVCFRLSGQMSKVNFLSYSTRNLLCKRMPALCERDLTFHTIKVSITAAKLLPRSRCMFTRYPGRKFLALTPGPLHPQPQLVRTQLSSFCFHAIQGESLLLLLMSCTLSLETQMEMPLTLFLFMELRHQMFFFSSLSCPQTESF